MERFVYITGEFVPAGEARVSVFDGGFLHGAGLFETMRAQNGRVFRLESHMRRLLRSAQALRLPITSGAMPGGAVFEQLLTRNALRSARVRLTATTGTVFSGDGAGSGPTLCITADELIEYPRELYEKGATVMISRRPQTSADPLAGHKTTCYLPRLLALQEARMAQCGEAIFFDEANHLAEGAVSNVFIVKQGTLLTPPLSTPVLPGIARALVLELAREEGIPAGDEEPLTIHDVLDAEEVFLTNSLMQVMPVTRVERRDIAEGKLGEITKRLLTAYQAKVREECGG